MKVHSYMPIVMFLLSCFMFGFVCGLEMHILMQTFWLILIGVSAYNITLNVGVSSND